MRTELRTGKCVLMRTEILPSTQQAPQNAGYSTSIAYCTDSVHKSQQAPQNAGFGVLTFSPKGGVYISVHIPLGRSLPKDVMLYSAPDAITGFTHLFTFLSTYHPAIWTGVNKNTYPIDYSGFNKNCKNPVPYFVIEIGGNYGG